MDEQKVERGPRPIFNLYLDDSGTRHPDRKRNPNGAGNWFALGGILIAEEHEGEARHLHESFCERWEINYPLHSVKIRGRKDNFDWLETGGEKQRTDFHSDLADLMAAMPVIGHACVIDRPGYSNRYEEKYGRDQWSLCKTAFSVICERVAKYASKHDRRVRVFVERSDKTADGMLKGYFRSMRDVGMPFSKEGSEKYGPLSPAELNYRLLDLTSRTKECRMTQMADIMLYPLCRGSYEPGYRPLQHLRANRKTVDQLLELAEVPSLGIKYSCFDG